jgi:hypothetical protein
MEPLVIFGAGLVIYCGYLTLLDSCKGWKFCRSRCAAKRAPAKKRHAAAGRQRQPKPATGLTVCRPLLQRI